MRGKKNEIGFWYSTSLVVGNMTGSGIFLLPAALAFYGGISLFGWILTTIGSLLLALVYARLSRLITKAGGPYEYTRRGFGDFSGFIVAWGYWISIWCGNAAIAVAGVGYLSYFFPSLKENHLLSALLAICAIWIFTLVNTRSIRKVGMVQLATTILKILPLVFMGTLGFVFFTKGHFSPLNLSTESNLHAVASTAALTLWAFLGLESATIPSDKVKNPQKTIPRATVVGLLIAALIFISSTIAVMGIIHPLDLQTSSAPFADAARVAWGPGAAAFVALGAAISCFGALNGWILIQGQLPLAAASDHLFPRLFKKVSKEGVPIPGIIVASILATILVSINYSEGLVFMFSRMILLSTFACLLPYLFSSLAEVTLYLTKKLEFKKRSLTIASLISIPAFLYSLWAISGLGIEIIVWGFGLLLVGVPIFFIMRWRRSKS